MEILAEKEQKLIRRDSQVIVPQIDQVGRVINYDESYKRCVAVDPYFSSLKQL
jgi:hypothetical protein